MSLRCQLRFTVQGGNSIAQVYRHSQGSPGYILPTLKHLRRLLQATETQRGPGYTGAQFVFVDSLWQLENSFRRLQTTEEDYPDTISEVLSVSAWREYQYAPPYLLGHSVENPSAGIHGDEEFIYLVCLPETRHEDWCVKVAGQKHFPPWEDDQTDRAFEQAEWIYEGPLEEALTNVGDES